MTTDHRTERRLGRPPAFLVIVVLVVLLVVGAWSAFWIVASRQAEAAVTDWLAQEAAAGRVHDCDNRRTGGYPFRFEVVCERPRLTLMADPEVTASGEELRAVVQVWRPDHVILEVDGPVRVEQGPDQSRAPSPLVADWDLLQASLLMPDGRIQAVDVASDGFDVRQEGAEGDGAVSLTAGHIELHQRHGAGPGPQSGTDLALSARELLLGYPGVSQGKPVDVTMTGRAVALSPEILTRPREFLSRWQEAGGSLAISSFEARQEDSRLIAQGRVEPRPEGQIEGNLTLALAGPDVTQPGAAGAFGGVAPFVATALRFVGESTEIEGEPAVRGRLALKNGKAYLGNFPIADLPRLY